MLQKYNAPYASDFDLCAKRATFVLEMTQSVFETEKKHFVFEMDRR